MKKSIDPLVASSGPSSDGSTVTNVGSALDCALLAATEVVHFPGLKKALAGDTSKKTTKQQPKEKKTMKTEQKTTAKKLAKKQTKPMAAKPVLAPATAPVPQPEKTAKTPTTLAPATAPVPQPEEVIEPENDILANILTVDGAGLMANMNRSLEVLDNEKAVQKFVEAIMAADTLMYSKVELGTIGKLEKPWLDMNLEETKRCLRNWASDGETMAKDILTELQKFESEKIKLQIVRNLWDLVATVIRPACKVMKFDDLWPLLEKLCDAGWAEVHKNRRRENVQIPADAIMVCNGEQYVVASTKKMASVAWQYVKQAEEQAEQTLRQERQDLNGMMKQGTKEFLASADPDLQEEGKLAFKLSPTHGAVLEVVRTVGGPRVRIIESIGMGNLPSFLIKFDAGMGAWPRDTGALYRAFQNWRRTAQ